MDELNPISDKCELILFLKMGQICISFQKLQKNYPQVYVIRTCLNSKNKNSGTKYLLKSGDGSQFFYNEK